MMFEVWITRSPVPAVAAVWLEYPESLASYCPGIFSLGKSGLERFAATLAVAVCRVPGTVVFSSSL